MLPASLVRNPFVHALRRLKKHWQDRLDLGRHYAALPVSGIVERKPETESMLRELHQQYCATYSNEVYSLSVETLLIWYNLIRLWQPDVILDLGSGLSTCVAHLAARNLAQAPTILSYDSDERWMTTTAAFLQAQGFQQTIQHIDELKSHVFEPGKRTLILNDIGHPGRFALREEVLHWLAPHLQIGTILLLDDVHKPDVRHCALALVKQRKLKCWGLCKQTFDRFGRYAWIIHQDRSHES